MLSRALLVIAFVLAPTMASAAPKITLAQARTIALGRMPGKIVHEDFKAKKVHYNFKIAASGANAKPHYLEKVEVDGTTGKVLKVKEIVDKANPPPGKKPKSDDDGDD